MMVTTYWVHTRGGDTLLRRDPDLGDQMWVDGRWQRTSYVLDITFGNDMDFDDTTEAQAKARWPEAFA
jgi:hypothetical protein